MITPALVPSVGGRSSAPDVLAAVVGHGTDRAEHPAVIDETRSWSYSQLCDRAAAAATELRHLGVGPGDRVAVDLGNTLEFVVVALAALWLGAIFVPLAEDDPPARRDAVLADCTPSAVVAWATPDHDSTGAAASATTPSVQAEPGRLLDGDPDDRPALPPRERPAYIVYTSGTTGSPKGVLIGAQAFAAAVASTADALELDGATRTLCVSPFHFDGSFATLWPTLAAGGTVVIRRRDALLFPRTFLRSVLAEAVTYTGFSPSYLRLVLGDPHASALAASSLRVVALGGEASTAAEVAALWRAAPQLRIFNRYGPTEATIAVTHAELDRTEVAAGLIPLGRPHPGVRFHVVGADGTVIDDGTVADRTALADGAGPGDGASAGELHVSGVQLMDRYWGAPELTGEVLRSDVTGELAYRTGDVVHRLADGRYVYVDRADRVVKRSGVRTSLVEVGAAFEALRDVGAARAVAYDEGGLLRIVVFVVPGPAATAPADPAALRGAARQSLPASMLPDRVVVVQALPLTGAGKLDEDRLLVDAGLSARPGGGEVTSRSAAPPLP